MGSALLGLDILTKLLAQKYLANGEMTIIEGVFGLKWKKQNPVKKSQMHLLSAKAVSDGSSSAKNAIIIGRARSTAPCGQVTGKKRQCSSRYKEFFMNLFHQKT